MFIPREYSINLPIHDDLPEDQRPMFRMRAATWSERMDIIEAGEDWKDADDERAIMARIVPLIKRHLIKAPFDGEVDQELEYVQLVELWARMKICDQLTALAKKNYVSPSPSVGVSSTETRA